MDISYNWKIHKKLLDAGGLGPVVYILPARGGSKLSAERERYLELLEGGRTVVYGRPDNRKKLVGARQPWILEDRDILTPEAYERAERIWNEYWKGVRDESRIY